MSEIVSLLVFAMSGVFDLFSKLIVALDAEKLLLEVFFVVVVSRLIVSRLIGGGYSGVGKTLTSSNRENRKNGCR